jgi:hypothetical protein
MKISSALLTLWLVTSSAAVAQEAPGVSTTQALDTSGPMSHAKFERYLATFNAGDLRFVEFYSPDIVFDKGPDEGKLIGRDAIRQWYADFWQNIREQITPLSIAIDGGGKVMLVELRTQLDSIRDGTRSPSAALNKGDRLVVDGLIVYTIEDGLITSIRGGSEGVTITRADGTREKR